MTSAPRSKKMFTKNHKKKTFSKKKKKKHLSLQDMYEEKLNKIREGAANESRAETLKEPEILDTNLAENVITTIYQRPLDKLLSQLSGSDSDSTSHNDSSSQSEEKFEKHFKASRLAYKTNIFKNRKMDEGKKNLYNTTRQDDISMSSNQSLLDLSDEDADLLSENFTDHMSDTEKDAHDDGVSNELQTIQCVFKEHSEIFDIQSFNKALPIKQQVTNTNNFIQLHPPGFASYKTREHSTTFYTQSLIDQLPTQKLPFISILENLTLAETDTVNSSDKLWKQWHQHIIPYLIEEQNIWKSLKPKQALSDLIQQASTLFQVISSYSDVYYAEQIYYNAETIRAVTMLHIAEHCVKMRNILSKNNSLLKEIIELRKCEKDDLKNVCSSKKKSICPSVNKLKNSFSQTKNIKQDKDMTYTSDCNKITQIHDEGKQDILYLEDELRDQGFTTPRVLLLASARHVAKSMIEMLLKILRNVKQIRNYKRFQKEFQNIEEDDTSPPLNRQEFAQELLNEGKSPDYAEQFRGNNCDQFRIGIKLHRCGVTLYAPFYQSDIIVASPLGLQLVVGSSGANKRDYDFLSSLEILVIDRADVISMQNWTHLKDLILVMNAKPQQWPSDCDIRRLRQSYSNGEARSFRQTIVLADGRLPEAMALFHHQNDAMCCNFRGFVKLFQNSSGSIISQNSSYVKKQLMLNVPCESLENLHESLLDFFDKQFPPSFLSSTSNKAVTDSRLLLVVPTYIEYLRLRKVLKTSKNILNDPRNLNTFRSCHEYSSNKMLSRSRQMFRSGEVNILLTTERFLFYRRYTLKGANHVIFYRPPYYPSIYTLCLQSLSIPENAISLILFTSFDQLNVEKYLGPIHTNKIFKMLSSVPKVILLNK